MYRRELIAATTVALGGCLGSAAPAESDTEQQTLGPVQPEAAPPPEVVLSFGEWYETESMALTVTGVETRHRLDGESTPDRALPPDTELAILTGEIKNTGDAPLGLPGDVAVSLAVVASDQLFTPVTGSESGAGDHVIDVRQIAVAADTHLGVDEAQISPGEHVSVWQAALVPAHLTTQEIEPTMCDSDGECGVRWEPAEKSCDCPG